MGEKAETGAKAKSHHEESGGDGILIELCEVCEMSHSETGSFPRGRTMWAAEKYRLHQRHPKLF